MQHRQLGFIFFLTISFDSADSHALDLSQTSYTKEQQSKINMGKNYDARLSDNNNILTSWVKLFPMDCRFSYISHCIILTHLVSSGFDIKHSKHEIMGIYQITCQSSSVTKGINGCSNLRMFSKMYNRAACDTDATEWSPEWYRRALLASMYLEK